MKQFIFRVKRTHNNGIQNSKFVIAPVVANTYQQALSRLKKAQCKCISFIEEQEFKMWNTKSIEVV